jgi:hypothetical protein
MYTKNQYIRSMCTESLTMYCVAQTRRRGRARMGDKKKSSRRSALRRLPVPSSPAARASMLLNTSPSSSPVPHPLEKRDSPPVAAPSSLNARRHRRAMSCYRSPCSARPPASSLRRRGPCSACPRCTYARRGRGRSHGDVGRR